MHSLVYQRGPYSGVIGFYMLCKWGDPLISWSGGGIRVAGGLPGPPEDQGAVSGVSGVFRGR